MQRPKANEEEDLEKLQEEFFKNRTAAPAARLVSPSKGSSKKSLFAQRLAQQKDQVAKSTSPPVSNDGEASNVDMEPVQDPFDAPFIRVSKKMIDLTSMLGNVLGEVTEHTVDKVEPPSLASAQRKGMHSMEHEHGFPQPARRALSSESAVVEPPKLESGFEQENRERIEAMSIEDIEQAREEIMSTLSKESIAFLMRRRQQSTAGKKTVTASAPHETIPSSSDAQQIVTGKIDKSDKTEKQSMGDMDLVQMKSKYFAQVPLEADKLAWMDDRFRSLSQPTHASTEASEQGLETSQDRLFRTTRFDLQGRPVNPDRPVPQHYGLHHHGDEPDKAGYTLAELFHLVRSQVASQRAMVLATLARILWRCKKHIRQQDDNAAWWQHILGLFSRHDIGAPVYLRSALDDRHLAVQINATQALGALVLDMEELEHEVLTMSQQKTTLSLSEPSRRGLAEKFTSAVDALRDQAGQPPEEEESDALVAERNLAEGFSRMNLLARIRYLMSSRSGLRASDWVSLETLVRIVVWLAKQSSQNCQIIAKDILPEVVDWGLRGTIWPMLDEQELRRGSYPSLAVVCLLEELARDGTVAKEVMIPLADKVLPFLVASPSVAAAPLQRRAGALQLVSLRFIGALLAHRWIPSVVEDLQEPMMGWLRAVMTTVDTFELTRGVVTLEILCDLVIAAAEPHTTEPVHAVHPTQATAATAIVTAILRSQTDAGVISSALKYLSRWAKYASVFCPTERDVREVWNAIAFGSRPTETPSTILYYVELLVAFIGLGFNDQARAVLASAEMATKLRQVYTEDQDGLCAFWHWMVQIPDRAQRAELWGLQYEDDELSAAVAASTSATDASLAKALVQMCVLDRLDERLISTLRPFYEPPASVVTTAALSSPST